MATSVAYRDDWTIEEAIAHAPRFWRFLAEVTSGDAELALFYVRWFGYSLFGHSLATKFLILSGKLGFNGKGALKRLMCRHAIREVRCQSVHSTPAAPRRSIRKTAPASARWPVRIRRDRRLAASAAASGRHRESRQAASRRRD